MSRIVCAVFALSEGTAFIGRKNYESDIFCHTDKGEPNVEKADSPVVYNVEFHDSSDCADQKISNQISSFFYDFIINQYKNNRSSYCSIMNNVVTNKKLLSNVSITYQKRKLLWSEKKLSPKTLRPPMDNCLSEDKNSEAPKCIGRKCKNKNCRVKNSKIKIKKKKMTTTTPKPRRKVEKCDLDCEDKKMFFSLKNLKRKGRKKKFKKRQLNVIKLGHDLNLNEIMRKPVERKEKYFVFASKKKGNNFLGDKSEQAFPLFSHIRNLFRFSKNSISEKKRDFHDIPHSVLVNNVKNKNKMPHIVNNFFEAVRKPARFRRNLGNSYSFIGSPVLPYRQNFIAQPYPYSANLKVKRSFLYPKINRKFIPGKILQKRHYTVRSNLEKPKKNFKNWPFHKSQNFENRDTRTERFEDIRSANLSSEISTTDETKTKSESSFFDCGEQPINRENSRENSFRCLNTKESLKKKKYSGTSSQKANSSFSSLSSSTVSLDFLNTKHDTWTNLLPHHTLEKPFLEKNKKKNKFSNEVLTSILKPNIKTIKSHYNTMTELPFRSSTILHPNRRSKSKSFDSEFLSPERFVKIRHALRNYLIRNNAWVPSKRVFPFERKKRYGRRACSAPHKCWRSAPLLCVPYIKKGQEDVLKFVIKFLQKMMGKPLPPKAEIFEKTKFKPYVEKEFENTASEEDYKDECETETETSTTPCHTTTQSCSTTTTCFLPPATAPITSSTTAPTTCSTASLTTCPTTPPTTCPTPCPTYPSTHPPTYSTTCPPNYFTTCPPTYPSTHPPTYSTTCPPNYFTTCPPTYPTTCPPNYPTIYPPNYFNTCPPTYPFTYPPNYSTTYPPNYPTTYPPNYSTTYPPNYPTTYPPNYPTTYPPNYSSTYPPNYPTTYPPNYPTTYPPNYPTTCPPNYPTIYPPHYTTTFPPTCPSTFPTTFKSPSTTFGPIMTKPLQSVSRTWPTNPKFSPATYLPSTCPTSTFNIQKPYFYQGLALSKAENKYPEFNSCPSSFPFMVPHMEQIINQVQNQKNPNDRLTTSPARLFASYTTTSLYHVPFISNLPLSESNFASNSPSEVPVKSTSTNAPSNCYRVNTLTLPARTQTKTDDTSSNILSSTMNYCSLYISSSSEGQEEYLSFTSVPYERPSECGTMAYEYSQSAQQKPLIQATTFSSNSNQNKFSKLHGEVCFANSEKRWQDVKNVPSQEYTTAFTSTEDTSEFQVTNDLFPSEDFTDLYDLERERKLKSKLRKNLLAFNQRKELRDDDYSMNEHPAHDPDFSIDKSYKRLFRLKHHKKTPKTSFKPYNKDFYSYNDYGFHKYLFPTQDESSTLSDDLISVGPNFWKKTKKIKTTTSLNSLVRRKRENDYYFWPEKFDSYNDYLNDVFQYNNENSEKHPSVKNISEEGDSEVNWTPPSYEMFSELAKAVTENNSTERESVEITTGADRNRKNFLVNSTHLVQPCNTSSTNNCINITKTGTENVGKVRDNGNISTSHSNYDFTTPKTKTTLPFNHSSTVSATKTTSHNINGSTCTKKITPQSSNNITLTTKTTSQSTSCSTTVKTTTSPEEEDTEISNQAASSNAKSNGHERVIDSKKSGKTSFFQANSKSIQNGMENSGFLTTARNLKKDAEREDEELEANQDLGSAEEIIPTTLKMASIVKGPKKLLTKPSPKMYSKVYPDSSEFEIETNETTRTTTVAPTKASIENKTALLSSTSAPDIRLQLLAVCEGYLEVVKLIKAQNQTIGEDLDADLARYCENIISQSFNCQLDKPKKAESAEMASQSPKPSAEVTENQFKNISTSNATLAAYGSAKEFSDAQLRDKIMVDILNNPAYRKVEKRKNKNINHEKTNSTDIDSSCGEEKFNSETEKKLINDSDLLFKKEARSQKKEETEDLLKKGMTQEQVELIGLLKKRKKALLSWLLNAKENKSEDLQETDYFEDEDLFAPDSDSEQCSGTIKPKRDDQSSGTTEKNFSYVNESIFPVYAKRYGYDKGGELREVEVLWRKVNEKTHEEKILKNLSVLALLLTSTESPKINSDDTKLVGNNGYENEEISEIESKSDNKVRFAAADLAPDRDKTTTPLNNNTETSTATLAPNSTTTSCVVNSTTTSEKKNATYTFISKPDPSSIVGAPPNVTKAHRNVTQKASHKLDVAKDIFQEYTIEFLNYAVYILPIMLTILFLFCVVCCALHILKTKKSIKRLKKKKKKLISTDESTETTEESEHESQKRRWGSKRKRKPKIRADDETLEEKRSKKFWNVLKLPSKSSKEFHEENNSTEKKKSFLRFLKSRKDEGKTEETSTQLNELDEYCKTYPDSAEGKTNESEEESLSVKKKNKEDDKPKSNDASEAAERRELIALLEELKKIETENTGEKKEVKSVHVQYMTEEDEVPAFQRSNFYYPDKKNVFGMPEKYSFYNKEFPSRKTNPPHLLRDYELYEDVNELTELLPCDCSYYAKKNDYMRHCNLRINQEGRCERYLKIYRDSGVSRDKYFRGKNFRQNESENRSFIFNRYRSISTDTSEELMGVTKNNTGTEVRFTDTASPFKLASQTKAVMVEEIDNFKRQLNKEKYVRLKDDGVLCKL